MPRSSREESGKLWFFLALFLIFYIALNESIKGLMVQSAIFLGIDYLEFAILLALVLFLIFVVFFGPRRIKETLKR